MDPTGTCLNPMNKRAMSLPGVADPPGAVPPACGLVGRCLKNWQAGVALWEGAAATTSMKNRKQLNPLAVLTTASWGLGLCVLLNGCGSAHHAKAPGVSLCVC